MDVQPAKIAQCMENTVLIRKLVVRFRSRAPMRDTCIMITPDMVVSHCFPHACGDGPYQIPNNQFGTAFSPRAWGWSLADCRRESASARRRLPPQCRTLLAAV